MNLTRMLRKHMKKFMIVFAALLAIALGMSTTMFEQMGAWFKSDYLGEVFGRTVTAHEFSAAQYRLRLYWMALYGDRVPVEDDEIWEHLAMLDEAASAGITVTDSEMRQDMISKYRAWRLVEDIRSSAADEQELRRKLWEYQMLTPQQRQARLEAIPFDIQDYKRILAAKLNVARSDLSYAFKMFHEACREFRVRSKLSEYIASNVLASSPSVYESFVEGKHERRIDYVSLNSENYTGRVKIDEAGLEEFYKKQELRYKEPERIAFEYVMACYDDVKATIEPTGEDLKNFYDNNKYRLFMRRDALRQDTERPLTPDQMVKPYEEVRDEVRDEYLRKKSEEKARELVDKARAEINALEDIAFLKVAALAAKQGLHAAETMPFSMDDFSSKLEHEFGFCPQAQRMFDRKDEIAELSTGKFEEPQTCDKGIFTYRLSKYLSERTSPLAEVRDKVAEAYTNSKAAEIAEEEAKRILKEARQAGKFTRELLEKEKLVLVSTDFFKRMADGGKIEAIQETKNNDAPVIGAAFELKKQNDFAEPVKVPKADTPLYYLVQYKGRKDPAAGEFVKEWTQLLSQRKDNDLQPFYEDWKKNLTERAAIKKPEKKVKKEEKKPEGAPGEEETEGAGEKQAQDSGQDKKAAEQPVKQPAGEKAAPGDKPEPEKPQGSPGG
jgi:hypothetical protein